MKKTQKINLIIDFLKQQVNISKTQGLLVGVSGGIDSALVATLIKKAFPDNSLGVIIPCHSSEKDMIDAKELCNKIDLKHIVVDISNEHRMLIDNIKKNLNNISITMDNEKMTDANTRARLRMSTLYAVASEMKYLVVGTDNKAELYTGYFTKHGDGGVDILPLANLSKREVYSLSEELGVPKSILEREPSAGLWKGQTDETELGVTYDEIDDYLEGKEISDISMKRIEYLHKISEHKRVMAPRPKK